MFSFIIGLGFGILIKSPNIKVAFHFSHVKLCGYFFAVPMVKERYRLWNVEWRPYGITLDTFQGFVDIVTCELVVIITNGFPTELTKRFPK